MKQSRSEFITLRGNKVHLRRWGNENSPVLFMFHGWMDMSATFQFVVDAMRQDWHVIAVDWAGFGHSPVRESCNHITDYMLDMNALIDAYSPGQPAKILAHSMGANVVNLYAGAFPEKVSHFANIESIGPIPGFEAMPSHRRIREWMERAVTTMERKTYDSVEAFALRLQKVNALLTNERAKFLASQITEPLPSGRVQLCADESARYVTPFFASREVFFSCWENISAKVLFFRGANSFLTHAFKAEPCELEARMAAFKNFREIVVDGAGHNIQHEFPELVAEEIEAFFSS